jgi:hypothetical protein
MVFLPLYFVRDDRWLRARTQAARKAQTIMLGQPRRLARRFQEA